MARLPTNRSRQGQSLIELMIAVTIGGILIGSAAILIAVTLKASSQNKFMQAASFLSQEMIDNVTVFSKHKWFCPQAPFCKNQSGSPGNYGIYNLTKSSHYYVDVSNAPFEWVSGEESSAALNLDGVQYTRYFYVENVCRHASNGNIVETTGETCTFGIEDPSTQKIIAVTSWPNGGEVKIEKFLTRNRNKVLIQTDWGGGFTTPALEIVQADAQTNKFYAGEEIDFSSVPGSIQIQAP